jgi:hypothetical protein
MPECFVSYYIAPYEKWKLQNPHCRCSLGVLDCKEIELFENDSEIGYNVNYVFHKGITLKTLAEERKHDQLLKQFLKEKKKLSKKPLVLYLEQRVIDRPAPPSIEQLLNFQQIANEIRELRPHVIEFPNLVKFKTSTHESKSSWNFFRWFPKRFMKSGDEAVGNVLTNLMISIIKHFSHH